MSVCLGTETAIVPSVSRMGKPLRKVAISTNHSRASPGLNIVSSVCVANKCCSIDRKSLQFLCISNEYIFSVFNLFYILTEFPPPSTPLILPPFPLAPSHMLLFCVCSERGRPPWVSIKHGISSCSKTKLLPLYLGWTGQSSIEKSS